MLVALSLGLAACGGDAAPAGEGAAEGEVESGDVDELEESGDVTQSDVEEVLQELAALPYEERYERMRECAIEEGAVLLYGSSNIDMQEAWADDFQERYPEINMLYVRAKSDDLAERLQAEDRAGRHLVDVVENNAVIGLSLHEQGLFVNHYGAPIPPDFPERYVEDWMVSNTINPNIIAWNTEVVADPPTDLDDVNDERFRGLAAIDSGSQNFMAGLVYERGRDGAEQWLQDFLANDGMVRRGHSTMAELMAAGEFGLMPEAYSHHIGGLMDAGAPLDWLAPDPTPANASGMSIYRGTQRPCASALLFHYFLSAQGGQVIADSGRLSVHPEAVIEYESLQVFLDPDSPEGQRVLPIQPAVAAETWDIALELIDEYLVPAVVE